MRQKTVIKNLSQSVTEVYYKVRQVLQSALGITKCDRLLLQSASGIIKCDRLLLQSVPGIAKCDSYHKVRCNTGHDDIDSNVIIIIIYCLATLLRSHFDMGVLL